MKEPRLGAAIPQDRWIQRTLTEDPNPRIPFSNGPANSPDTFPPMQPWEKIAWSTLTGLALGMIAFGNYAGVIW